MDILFVGIDFGTMNTAIVASNGMRTVQQTVVGWPRDYVARKKLGKEVLFGEEVQLHRLALNIVRPFHKGALKYGSASSGGADQAGLERSKMAARLILEHVIQSVDPPSGHQILGVVGVPAEASVQNKQLLLELAREVMDVAVLVPEPFAVGFCQDQAQNALVVDIGAGTIDLCHLYGALPTERDQLTIAYGGDYVDEDFMNRMAEAVPQARLALGVARSIKERHGFVGNELHPVLVSLPTRGGTPQIVDVSVPLHAACTTLADSVVDGLREMLDRLDPEFHSELLAHILLGGGGSQLRGLDDYIDSALESYGQVGVTRLHDSAFAGATGALRLAMSMPEEDWKAVQQADLRSGTRRRVA
jgi:rod shape-determining protein MreB